MKAAEFYPGAHLAARGDHPAVIVHDHAADNDQPERAHLFTSLLDAIDADD